MSATSLAPANQELNGARKAAVLLMSLSTEQAASMLRRLPDADVETILAEVATLNDVEPSTVDEVFAEFATSASEHRHATNGGAELARTLLLATVGAERAEELALSMPALFGHRPFEFLYAVEPRLSAGFLADENPQTIALVLANISTDLAADLLRALPADFRRDVAVRIATLDRTSPEVVTLIEAHLAAFRDHHRR